MMETALILCEGRYAKDVGKTANGLVRRSARYQILGVIDSTKHGQDAGEVLDGIRRNIPIFSSLKIALENLPRKPDWLIIGVATIGGRLPVEFRPQIRYALKCGIGILSGLHEYLGDDEEFSSLSEEYGSRIVDVRRPPPLEELHHFKDLAGKLSALRIPVLGTDSSIGKRTTAMLLTETLNKNGIKSVFVATGQTGLLQGAKYGLPLDSIKSDYMVGELENQIVLAQEKEKPDVIVIEGQGSISHPAYVCGTRAIIAASQPNGIILQFAPRRMKRNYHPEELGLSIMPLEKEIEMLKIFSGCDVIALSLNHQGIKKDEIEGVMREYEARYALPVCDPLYNGCDKLARAIRRLLT